MEKIFDLLSELNNKLDLNLVYCEEYRMAFTHSSYLNEVRTLDKKSHYERLEFLGDAVLELAVSDYLYKKFSNLTEGELTKLRASIVCEPTLLKYAKQLKFDKYILLGKGEEKTGGRNRAALLADIFESFIGALYIDKGMADVKKFLGKTLFTEVTDEAFQSFVDYKTLLQEFVGKTSKSDISYKLISSEGPSHAKIFSSKVYINDEEYGHGKAKTKKESEQLCAKVALEKLNYY